jgi:hydrogenase expression/formation protein HypC
MCLAIPGQVLSLEGGNALMRSGRVSFAGIVKLVNFAYVPEVKLGNYVLVHAGFGIAIVDEDEALKTLAYLAEIEPEELS